jgi:hypothetical protein
VLNAKQQAFETQTSTQIAKTIVFQLVMTSEKMSPYSDHVKRGIPNYREKFVEALVNITEFDPHMPNNHSLTSWSE